MMVTTIARNATEISPKIHDDAKADKRMADKGLGRDVPMEATPILVQKRTTRQLTPELIYNLVEP